MPFANALAQYVLMRYGEDPLVLSNMMILLPTRRSCRALTDAFLHLSKGKALVLPKIEPMGDMEEEEAMFSFLAKGIETNLPRVISSTEQRLLLTQLVQAWQRALHHNSTDKQQQKEMTLAQSAHLAVELSSFLADIQRQQLSIEQLDQIVPEEFASHWQITLKFLNILMEIWPGILKEKKMVDPADYRNLAIEMQCRFWQQEAKDAVVIAAGSTGSIPSVAKLLKTISELKNGLVVLPGLDQHMSDAAWQDIEQSHPQYGLKQLLERLSVERRDVTVIEESRDDIGFMRSQLVSYVMLPANHSQTWQQCHILTNEVLEGLSLITAGSLQEEAEVIALYLRLVLETPGKTAALITHERSLARKVSTILARWGIAVDDSAGLALSSTAPVVFLQLIIEVLNSNVSVKSLLALLKHPFAAVGMEPVAFRHQMYALEKDVLRGKTITNGFVGIKALLEAREKKELLLLIEKIEAVLTPFLELAKQSETALHTLLTKHIEVARQLAQTHEKTGGEHLFDNEAGESLAQMLDDMLVSSLKFQSIHPKDYQGLFEALIAGKVFRPRFGKHPRLSILGPIEARMLPFDFIILGGMNEGTWPGLPDTDPWMSRPMRSRFGLPLPERKIGLSAHDFAQMICMPNVLLTRSEKVSGKETIPSRWLAKLNVILGFQGLESKLANTDPWRLWLRELQKPANICPITAPEPRPMVETRPQKFSVTEIELWMRDPYAIYAKRILGLRPLDPLDYLPTMADFGNMVHGVCDEYVKAYQAIPDGRHIEYVMELGKKQIDQFSLHPIAHEFWWKRFISIMTWFVENEHQVRKLRIDVQSEVWGEVFINSVTLGAKIDRLEYHSGQMHIVDYKTGVLPTKSDIRQGFAPQMILEALLAKHGAFGRNILPEHLWYWHMRGVVDEAVLVKSVLDEKDNLEDMVTEAASGLARLITTFMQQETPYMAIPDPAKAPKYNAYEHLERLKEWQVSGGL